MKDQEQRAECLWCEKMVLLYREPVTETLHFTGHDWRGGERCANSHKRVFDFEIKKIHVAIRPVSFWGRKPLYAAKVGTTASNLIMVRRVRNFHVGQQIMFATLSEVEGMSVGCTPAWRSGNIWKIEANRLFVDRF